MENITIEDWIGYVASFFVVTSFLMTELKTIRIINTIGAFLFIAYGILIDKIPVIIPNVGIAIIQIYHLFIKKTKN